METVTVRVHEDHSLSVGCLMTGYVVSEHFGGTVLIKNYPDEYGYFKDLGYIVEMPSKRYNLSNENAVNGVPGVNQFREDVLDIWNA